MAHKFFFAWQSEQPGSVCRNFIRNALDSISNELQQLGVDERIEIDSDTQNVPGVPEILSTILKKIDEDDVFVADLTMCTEPSKDDKSRMSPNSNVMFEYGYAMKAKGRDRIICIMNAHYGGNDPADLPFDLRHARAPIRYHLAPDAKPEAIQKTLFKLRGDLLTAAKLILENIPSPKIDHSSVDFRAPNFSEGQVLTQEGDFAGQNNPTSFDKCAGFVYLRGRPLRLVELSIAQIRKNEDATGGLTISSGSSGGSFGTNKFGRISYALRGGVQGRLSCDYVQYFRTGEIEIVNGSYMTIVKRDGGNTIHADYLTTQIVSKMLRIAGQWLDRAGFTNFFIEVGIMGIEGCRLTLSNFGTGPMIHADKVSIKRKVDKDSILLLEQEFRSTLLAEAGLDV